MATQQQLNRIKFGHGKAEKIPAALAEGKLDRDDFIVDANTDDQVFFVGHDGTAKPLKARTDEDFTLQGVTIGALSDGDTIPKGTSIDDLIKLLGTGTANSQPQIYAKTTEEWSGSNAVIFPAGSILVYLDESGVKMKIADGAKTVAQLPFYSLSTTQPSTVPHATLTIGNIIFDGSEDKTVPVYNGE